MHINYEYSGLPTRTYFLLIYYYYFYLLKTFWKSFAKPIPFEQSLPFPAIIYNSNIIIFNPYNSLFYITTRRWYFVIIGSIYYSFVVIPDWLHSNISWIIYNTWPVQIVGTRYFSIYSQLLSIIAPRSVQCLKLWDDMVVERQVHFGSRHVRYLGNPVIIQAIDHKL